MSRYDPDPDYDDDCGRDGRQNCHKCGGSGYFSDCFDDLCHGQEECIHGDDATCSRCGGTGEEPR